MPRIALVTAVAAFGLDEDIPLLAAALAARGFACEELAWDDPTVSWGRFDAALLRSTWDYAERRDEFLAWCARCAARTRLVNSQDIVRWNTDKRYLAALAEAGIDIVDSVFIEPDQSSVQLPAWDEFVVKPAVGAGSRDARRYRAEERPQALAHVERLQVAGRAVLAQPYLDGVDAHGETALVYFDGAFSHAICKGALLQPGFGATEELFAPERISPREPSAAERGLGDATMAVLPDLLALDRAPLYARVDLLPSAQGPKLLELELTEPSVFLAHAAHAAERFAECVAGRLGEASLPRSG